MGEDTTYEGWSNYPTWAVNLWLSNDEPLYHETLELVADVLDGIEDDENVASGIWSVEQTARFRTADRLKDWVTNELGDEDNRVAGLTVDLYGWALAQVDWNEIADAWIEIVKESAATA